MERKRRNKECEWIQKKRMQGGRKGKGTAKKGEERRKEKAKNQDNRIEKNEKRKKRK